MLVITAAGGYADGDVTSPTEDRCMTTCPECGAAHNDGLTCEARFHLLLAWEAQDAALQQVHFLTVASYNLQHPAMFQPAALAGLRSAFRAYLRDGVPISAVRAAMRPSVDGATKVLRPIAERQPVLRTWPMTIADVTLPDQPAGAAERVQAWAQAILHVLESNTNC
ncbi:MAG: hypothetical protein HC828_06610 [Blastochloris sp.]|nr:hypothetical protein [Blastochloris sp.]